MSKALRDTKCFNRSTACAGQTSAPVQRRTVSPSSRTAWLPQTGHFSRKFVSLRVLRPLVEHDADDLRDHVAGTLHDDRVALANVDAVADRLAVVADRRDIVLVVQRGVGDDDAADGDRRKPRHRRQRAGAADLDVDFLQHRRRLLGGELVRDRPARVAPCKPQPLLPVEPVDLVDDAVDVVAELGALAVDLA